MITQASPLKYETNSSPRATGGASPTPREKTTPCINLKNKNSMATKEPTQKAKLALTLWDTQEAFWNDCKERYKEENSNVGTNVKKSTDGN